MDSKEPPRNDSIVGIEKDLSSSQKRNARRQRLKSSNNNKNNNGSNDGNTWSGSDVSDPAEGNRASSSFALPKLETKRTINNYLI